MATLKHIIAILILSTLVVLFMPQAQVAVQALLTAHEWISSLLTDIFTGGQAGSIARGLIALLSIPLLAGLIPALIYWVVRKRWLPCFMEIMWVIWLIQAGALIVASKTVVSL